MKYNLQLLEGVVSGAAARALGGRGKLRVVLEPKFPVS